MRSDHFAHVTLTFRRRGDLWIRLARENNVVITGSTLVVSCDVISKMFVFAQLSWIPVSKILDHHAAAATFPAEVVSADDSVSCVEVVVGAVEVASR